MGQSDNLQWLKNYGQAFANGVNPMVGIGEIVDKNTQAMYPGPQIPTPPTPQHWSTQHGGPLFPYTPPSQGAPADFGGTVLPNPDGIRPMADTDSTAVRNPAFSTQNFYGRPKGDISNPPKNQMEQRKRQQ